LKTTINLPYIDISGIIIRNMAESIDYIDETETWEGFRQVMGEVFGRVVLSNTVVAGKWIDADTYPSEVVASLQK
jgi:hypothetical protein